MVRQLAVWEECCTLKIRIRARVSVSIGAQAELAVWEDGVVRSAKSLNQWELLSEFAKQTQQPQLLMAWPAG